MQQKNQLPRGREGLNREFRCKARGLPLSVEKAVDEKDNSLRPAESVDIPCFRKGDL